jgi:hypothetical protein
VSERAAASAERRTPVTHMRRVQHMPCVSSAIKTTFNCSARCASVRARAHASRCASAAAPEWAAPRAPRRGLR